MSLLKDAFLNVSHIKKINTEEFYRQDSEGHQNTANTILFNIDTQWLIEQICDCYESHLEDFSKHQAIELIHEVTEKITGNNNVSIHAKENGHIEIKCPPYENKTANEREREVLDYITYAIKQEIRDELVAPGRDVIDLSNIERIDHGYICNTRLVKEDVSPATLSSMPIKAITFELDTSKAEEELTAKLDEMDVSAVRAKGMIDAAFRIAVKETPNLTVCDTISDASDDSTYRLKAGFHRVQQVTANDLNKIINANFNDVLESVVLYSINFPEDAVELNATADSIGHFKMQKCNVLLNQLMCHDENSEIIVSALKEQKVVVSDPEEIIKLINTKGIDEVNVKPLSQFGGRDNLVEVVLSKEMKEELNDTRIAIHRKLEKKEKSQERNNDSELSL